MIETIDSVPGYRLPAGIDPATGKKVACPTNPADYPNTIRIALYSIADQSFVDSLIDAHTRCVSVKLLMNSHLNVDNSPSWRRLLNGIGERGGNFVNQRSYAYRCSNGCIGSTVLHSKFYLFSQAGNARNVTMIGSSNMTSNAVGVQWNDLFTVNGNDQALYDTYTHMWNRMTPDKRGNGPFVYQSGQYTSTFYPCARRTGTTTRRSTRCKTIHCTGATGGAGYKGHTVVYIVMHAWHGNRGLYLAKRVRQLYDPAATSGSSTASWATAPTTLLTRDTNSRMIARRVLFPGPSGLVAAKYSHMKMFAASGNVGGDSVGLGHLDRLEQLGGPQHQGRRGHPADPVEVGLQRLRRPLELHARPALLERLGDLRGAGRRRPRPRLTGSPPRSTLRPPRETPAPGGRRGFTGNHPATLAAKNVPTRRLWRRKTC